MTAIVESCDGQLSDYCEPVETVVATIPVGDAAGDIAVSSGSGRVYVTTGNAITVIDNGDEIVGSVAIAGRPKCMRANADGTRIYVVGWDGSASVINTADNACRTVPALGSGADAISPDGRWIYAAQHEPDGTGGSDWISAMDAEATMVASTPVPGRVTGLAVSPNGHWLYAVINVCRANVAGALLVIDAAALMVVDTVIVGIGGDTVIASPDGARVYVTHHDTNAVSIVDFVAKRVSCVALDDAPLDVVVTPDSTHLYVINSDSLTVIDAATNEAQTVSRGGLPRRMQLSPDGKHGYVTNFGDHTISVLDTLTNTVIATVDVGGHPEAVATSPDGERLYVSDYWAGSLTVISVNSLPSVIS